MNETIQIVDGEQEEYTAKDAMRYALEYLQSDKPQPIQKISCSHAMAQDTEAELFLKMFGRLLHMNRSKVFLFAETEELLAKMIEVLPERYTGIQIVSVATLDEKGVSDDLILNRINGDEVECIIAAMSEEAEDNFYEKYRNSLDVKIWVELGTNLRVKKKIWDFLMRKKRK